MHLTNWTYQIWDFCMIVSKWLRGLFWSRH
jgi:hypothetical protein